MTLEYSPSPSRPAGNTVDRLTFQVVADSCVDLHSQARSRLAEYVGAPDSADYYLDIEPLIQTAQHHVTTWLATVNAYVRRPTY